MINNFELYIDNLKRVCKFNNFEKLNNKSILITGANGLIASCIIDLLNYLNNYENYNIKIIALIRNIKKAEDRFKGYNNLNLYYHDVLNPIDYSNSVDYIIHAASNSNPKLYSVEPVETMLGNFIGIKNVLEFASKNNCKRVEYVSSGEVYGHGEGEFEAFTEDYIGKNDSMNPRSCYPLSKLASETLCVSYSKEYDIETVVVRPCHVYGPTQTESDNRVSAQFINNVLNNEDIVMKSNGSQIRSYCYVVDCAAAMLKVLTDGENCEAYNIANKNSIVSIKEMAELIAECENRKVVFEKPNEIEKSGYTTIQRGVLDESKLEKIGWIPCFNFKEGIKNTINIMR